MLFRSTEDLLDRFKSTTEEILAKFLETGASKRGIEVNTLEKRVDFNRGLSSRRKSALGTFASGAQTTNSTRIRREIYIIISNKLIESRHKKKSKTFLIFALKLLDKVVDETVVKIFSTKMSVTSGSLDFENALFNSKE